MVVRVSVLWQTTGTPTHNEQVMLDLEPGEPVVRAARLRLQDGEALSYELVSVPIALLPRANGTSPFQDIQELAAANRLRLGRATERRSQAAADRILAKHLGVAEGSPLDMLDRVTHLDTGRPAEWRVAYLKP